MQEILFPKPKIHLFICVNDRTAIPNNTMPSCGPTITPEHVKEIKQWIREQGWTGVVVATKCQCLGLCHPEGGVVCVYPSGKFFKGIRSVDDVKEILENEINKNH